MLDRNGKIRATGTLERHTPAIHKQRRGSELKIPSPARNAASGETTTPRAATRRRPRRHRSGFGNPLTRFKVVLDRDYARLWGIGVSTSTMRWLETVALGVYVYDLTESAFLVGFVGFLRMAPMLFLGAFIGAFSDRVNRRAILAATNIFLASVYLTLGLLILTDRIELWHVSAGALVSGVVWATDFPVRRAMIADIVSADRVSSAFGVDMASSNFSRVIGPIVGLDINLNSGIKAE
ncbi:MAG: MFS transporter [Chloroflexi bacterium]|nr:MFS transporter [Chloroflexota bacterium]